MDRRGEQAVPARRMTHADYAKLPEGTPAQLIEGEIVMTPSPVSRHQRIVFAIARRLADWAEQTKAGEAFLSPFDVILDDENTLQPDALFVRKDRLSIVTDWCRGAPDLVVEVISPSSASLDRVRKPRLYARFGVPKLWLVDPEERTFECFRLVEGNLTVEANFVDDEVARPPGFEPLEIPLTSLWPTP